ncbi:Alpha N-terminal protein methyltransferase 1 [Loxospora ochrophaea]|nr:Alpha N-terminal protein methyltransferase 1 [Loxospora ochrophaea]
MSASPPNPPLPPDTLISPSASLTYWSSHPPTITSMLGGYPSISRTDLRGSYNFLSKLRRSHPPPQSHPSSPSPIPLSASTTTTATGTSSSHSNRTALPLLPHALDCGAGIGRVTAGFLSKIATTTDLVEPVAAFSETARAAKMQGAGTVGHVYVCTLQDWDPPAAVAGGKYDLIWHQWCLGHLTDAQVETHFRKCRGALKEEGGWMVVKENVVREGGDVFDEVDSSVTRAAGKWRGLFERGGWRVVREEVQGGFPVGLFPVVMWGLVRGEGR